MQESTTHPQSSWDADFEAMTQNSSSAINAELIEDPVVDADIKRPIYKSPPLKMLVLFSGSALVITGIAFAFFGSSFNNGGDAQVAKSPKQPTTSTLSTSDQERLANAEAANAMGGSSKAFDAHNQDTNKKEDSTPARSPDTDQKPTTEVPKPPVAEAPRASTPVATKPVVVQPVPVTPVVQKQPKSIQPAPAKSPTTDRKPTTEVPKPPVAEAPRASTPVATKPVVVQPAPATPVVQQQPKSIQPAQPTKVATNYNQDARVELLERKIDKLTAALEKQNTQLREIKALGKPVTVAAAPTKEPSPKKGTASARSTQAERPLAVTTPQLQIQQVAPVTLPAIDGRATAKLFDPVIISAGNSSNSPQKIVRVQLTEPIPTSTGMEIPAGSIVAMNISVASNGIVTGSSTGVWDVKTQKQFNIPAGTLVVEGVEESNGLPKMLVAQSIEPNGGGAQSADTQAALWGAVGAGVDGLTRPDSSSSITAGTIVTTATSGGNRDFLVNAAGGFAKSKANSLAADATKRRDKISAQADSWYLPSGTKVMISTRPTIPVANSRYGQISNITGGQYQNDRQEEPLPPIPTRYAIDPTQR